MTRIEVSLRKNIGVACLFAVSMSKCAAKAEGLLLTSQLCHVAELWITVGRAEGVSLET